MNAACAGNLLASEMVPGAMLDAFRSTEAACLGDRLMAAMRAGLLEGGEAGPVHSAGMLVVDAVAWPVADLRVDWSDHDPVGELVSLWSLYAPQVESYTRRALDPAAAPSYGVAGDP